MMIRKLITRTFTLFFMLFTLAGCGDDTKIEQPFIVVAFGDSLTEGFSLPTDKAFPALLQSHFMANGHTGVKVMNMGISGDTTEAGLARVHFVINAQPQLVILELGANDMLRNLPVEEARENLATMLAAFRAAKIPVVLCGVKVPAVFTLGNPNIGAYGKMFASLADEFDVAFYPDFLKNVAGKKSLNLQDGLHPNESGTEVLAETLYPKVEKLALHIYATMAKEQPAH